MNESSRPVVTAALLPRLTIMQVVQYSVIDLVDGILGDKPVLYVNVAIYVILGAVIVIKLVLYFVCGYSSTVCKSDCKLPMHRRRSACFALE